ncbi:hypothetical protein FNF29_03351 [Cafeteria roenbergensis]|uniref:EF-hand domain-containing protein n=1 Tax=Cafeteria roenbergensis TaxID=33653 RepID=A0A5A8E1B2_CAFRO|nr:hypothetical protein FNF29_03351 [Cafeteria roenbergensis]KAA0162617.1 hypothetical protein FNF31_03145 [Cafeteria roenbergensis]KAA0170734.1 hypothetical protein FNF28_01275 [Cafeteria roenbergensis]|eukprot:KAA0153162.1 hypothetical protein FNF29_03351 [Cafeteria roenbergensis]
MASRPADAAAQSAAHFKVLTAPGQRCDEDVLEMMHYASDSGSGGKASAGTSGNAQGLPYPDSDPLPLPDVVMRASAHPPRTELDDVTAGPLRLALLTGLSDVQPARLRDVLPGAAGETLSRESFISGVLRLLAEPGSHPPVTAAAARPALSALFDSLDVDASGGLDTAEMCAGVLLLSRAPHQARADATFALAAAWSSPLHHSRPAHGVPAAALAACLAPSMSLLLQERPSVMSRTLVTAKSADVEGAAAPSARFLARAVAAAASAGSSASGGRGDGVVALAAWRALCAKAAAAGAQLARAEAAAIGREQARFERGTAEHSAAAARLARSQEAASTGLLAAVALVKLAAQAISQPGVTLPRIPPAAPATGPKAGSQPASDAPEEIDADALPRFPGTAKARRQGSAAGQAAPYPTAASVAAPGGAPANAPGPIAMQAAASLPDAGQPPPPPYSAADEAAAPRAARRASVGSAQSGAAPPPLQAGVSSTDASGRRAALANLSANVASLAARMGLDSVPLDALSRAFALVGVPLQHSAATHRPAAPSAALPGRRDAPGKTHRVSSTQFAAAVSNAAMAAGTVADPDAVRTAFRAMDTSSDGSVSSAEVAVGVVVLSASTPSARAERIFALFDIDGDGRVSQLELTACLASLFRLAAAVDESCLGDVASGPGELAVLTAQEVMEQSDVDRDGFIDREEWRAWIAGRASGRGSSSAAAAAAAGRSAADAAAAELVALVGKGLLSAQALQVARDDGSAGASCLGLDAGPEDVDGHTALRRRPGLLRAVLGIRGATPEQLAGRVQRAAGPDGLISMDTLGPALDGLADQGPQRGLFVGASAAVEAAAAAVAGGAAPPRRYIPASSMLPAARGAVLRRVFRACSVGGGDSARGDVIAAVLAVLALAPAADRARAATAALTASTDSPGAGLAVGDLAALLSALLSLRRALLRISHPWVADSPLLDDTVSAEARLSHAQAMLRAGHRLARDLLADEGGPSLSPAALAAWMEGPGAWLTDIEDPRFLAPVPQHVLVVAAGPTSPDEAPGAAAAVAVPVPPPAAAAAAAAARQMRVAGATCRLALHAQPASSAAADDGSTPVLTDAAEEAAEAGLLSDEDEDEAAWLAAAGPSLDAAIRRYKEQCAAREELSSTEGEGSEASGNVAGAATAAAAAAAAPAARPPAHVAAAATAAAAAAAAASAPGPAQPSRAGRQADASSEWAGRASAGASPRSAMAAAATVCEEGRAREAKADLRSMLVLDTMSPAQAAARLAPLLAPAVSRPLSVGELACLVSRFRGGDGTIKSMPRSATLQVGALFAALDTDGSSGLDAAELAVGITVLASGSHADKLVAATLLCEAVRTVSGGLIDQADLPVTLLRLATRLPDSVVLSPETVRTVADAALRTQAALSPALTRDCLRFVAEHGGPDGAPGAADGVDLCRAARQLLAASDPVPRPGDVGWEVAAACATVAASGTHAEFDAWLDDNDEQPTVAAFARFHATEASSTELQGLGSAAGAASSAANPGALAAALDAHAGPGRTPAADEDADSTGTANTDTAPELPSGFTPGETTASLQGSASRHAASFSPGMPAIVGVGPAHARGGSSGLIGRAADIGPGSFPAASAGRAQSLPLAEAGTLFAAPALSPAHGGAPSSSNPLPSAPPYPVPSAPPSAIASSGRHASDGSGSAFGMPAVDPATVGLGSKEWEAAPDTGAADLRGGEQR